MFIQGLGTATPPWRYTQQDCWQAVQVSPQFAQLSARSRAILKKVLLGDNGIEARSLALPALDQAFVISPDALHSRFLTHAPALATLAAERAFADAQTAASEIDAVLVSTCTGYLCPGLTSHLTERLRLPNRVFALDLVGQGCGAAMPNLRAAKALIDSHRYQRVLCVCVEICSAAFYLDDDPGVLVSACLFADSAAAAVVGAAPNPVRPVAWIADGSLLDPCHRDLLRFEQKEGLLRNILAPCVPTVAARYARNVFESTAAAAGLSQRDINAWILHAGGREVLQQLQSSLTLEPASLRWSAGVLRQFGNLSSPSILFALQSALAGGEQDGFWWMSSFGAGFSCHGAILKVSYG